MPQPTPSDVHVNRPLGNISVAFIQDQNEFIAEDAFPRVPVRHQSNLYFVYDKGNWFRAGAKKRAPATESAGSGYELTTDSYFADVFAFHKDVDDDVRANQDEPINVDREATMFVTRNLLLTREVTWAARYFTTGVWTGSTTGGDITPATLWDAGGSTPIEDIRAELLATKRRTGFRANTVVMGEEVWNVLEDHVDFLERIKFTQTAIVTTELFAAVLGVRRVLIGGAIQNNAIEGATDDLQFIFGKNLLVVYSAPSPGILTPSGGYTFEWTDRVGGASRILRFRMNEKKSDRIEGEMTFDQKVVASEMGAFLTGVIS